MPSKETTEGDTVKNAAAAQSGERYKAEKQNRRHQFFTLDSSGF